MILQYNPLYVERWLKGTTEHCMRVEYFLKELGIKGTDPQRPHDIVGKWNKFEQDIVLGMSTVYLEQNNGLLAEAIRKHRGQFHHRVWSVESTIEDKEINVVDAVCASLESSVYRPYQEEHGWLEILEGVKTQKFGEVRRLFTEIVLEMRQIGEPEIEIPHLRHLVNPDLDSDIFDRIRERVNQTLNIFEIH